MRISEFQEENNLDKKICPLCGKPNDCHMENGKDPSTCWCNEVKMPEGIFELLPEGAQRKACICRSCVESFGS